MKYKEIVKTLRKEFPGARTALNFGDPLQLLVATMLSAQCTDDRVNKVTPGLFRKYPGASAFASADVNELEGIIRSTGFFRSKAKNIIGAAREIEKRFSGKVPGTMGELIMLPGVARKTANVVLSGAYGVIEGVVVDTHVKRLAFRMGFTKNTDPVKVEQDLMKISPKKEWPVLSHLLIFHGRKTCSARKPLCYVCSVSRYCPRKGVK